MYVNQRLQFSQAEIPVSRLSVVRFEVAVWDVLLPKCFPKMAAVCLLQRVTVIRLHVTSVLPHHLVSSRQNTGSKIFVMGC